MIPEAIISIIMVHRRRPESVLRCQAAALLKSKEEEASIFNKEAEDAIPKFEPRGERQTAATSDGIREATVALSFYSSQISFQANSYHHTYL